MLQNKIKVLKNNKKIDNRLSSPYNWIDRSRDKFYKGSITMRIKKGFTLAEILIVLMVIGAIATMTIPSLMRGVTESQWKTAYKKAYNTIVNLTAMERISGQLPSSANEVGITKMFQSLNSNLSVKDYAAIPTDLSDGNTLTTSAFYSGVKFTDAAGNLLDPGGDDVYDASAINDISPWIITEDNLAYIVTTSGESSCGTKQQINAAENAADAAKLSCVYIVVDVNGLTNGPNIIEPQLTGTQGLTPQNAMNTLTGDRYYIFVGLDGATAGSKKTTVTGRIAADIK